MLLGHRNAYSLLTLRLRRAALRVDGITRVVGFLTGTDLIEIAACGARLGYGFLSRVRSFFKGRGAIGLALGCQNLRELPFGLLRLHVFLPEDGLAVVRIRKTQFLCHPVALGFKIKGLVAHRPSSVRECEGTAPESSVKALSKTSRPRSAASRERMIVTSVCSLSPVRTS